MEIFFRLNIISLVILILMISSTNNVNACTSFYRYAPNSICVPHCEEVVEIDGTYNLKITGVTKLENGVYYCEVVDCNGECEEPKSR